MSLRAKDAEATASEKSADGEAIPHADIGSGRTLAVVAVLCFGGLVAAVMQTLIIPIQPELPGRLGTSIENASWVITATLLGGAVAMPIAGRLADMFGKQRVLAVSAGLLIVGSVIAALGSSLPALVAGRAVQGMAMGFIPVGISLMREVTPEHLTSMAVSAMSAMMGVGAGVGLPVAAWISQSMDWHVLFWMSGGLGLIVLVLTLLVVPHIDDAVGGRLDLAGALGLSAGLITVLTAITKGNHWGWSSPITLGLLGGGLGVLLLWGLFELRHIDPLVDLRTTARPAVLCTNIASIAIGFGMMAQAVAIPLLLETPASTGAGLGQTVLQAGLWMAPFGGMMLLMSPVSGTLIRRIGGRYAFLIGAALLGAGYLFALFLMDTPVQIMIASIVCAAGVGVAYSAMPTLIMDNVPADESGAAVGLNGLMRSIGTTSASAVIAMVLAGSTVTVAGHDYPDQSAFRWCFLIGAAASYVGFLIALLIPHGSE
ncbi:MFS transporter [Gordonia amarae]|uniref:MFS transporter n=2 Tax=Gordonia amarae TaxID=36821 RepID=A0A857L1J5_9ACTN|nr:MFS transporter [Gordonia amarae]MCS3880624.1 MFS family permease [Gordonia amarae]QHN18931.1 MFS transporter [Gordonia amarae]QHN23406.1 MFS transporter [Gordonia amarae]QHN32307.1 MFS transporter [Gordonia amarae]QHN41055.1 MFS transporter [Gordonia amarae]